ncbi:MAG: LCP family protein [Oscillospiraceae bacterium]|nr:LCP family protein [Oscillospiraceae bacterium]
MKLTGSIKGGRHLPKNVSKAPSNAVAADSNRTSKDDAKGKKGSRPKRLIKIAILSVVVVAVAAISVVALDFIFDTEFIISPPDVNEVPRPSNPNTSNQNPNPNNPTQSNVLLEEPGDVLGGNPRAEGMFTFLIFGMDEGEANADVIMVATFDSVNHSLDVVSIPRDTLVNVEWTPKLANSVLPRMRARYRGEPDRDELAMQASVEKFADILGFEVDFWMTVNMDAFTTLIDAIGGIDFYVPVVMRYTDRAAGLSINFDRGMHHGLTGQQSLEILRFRSFANADIGRISVQQQFLSSAVEQILARRSSLGTPANIMRLANIALNHVRTNISLDSLAWLARELLQLNQENIRFHIVPANGNDFVGNRSYVTIFLDEWLELLNDRLNPFSYDKTAEDLSILTRGPDRRLFVTDGNWAGDPNWGATSRGSNPNQVSPTTAETRLSVINVSGGGGTTGGGNTGGAGAQAPQQGAPTTPDVPSGDSYDTVEEADGEGVDSDAVDGQYDAPDFFEVPPDYDYYASQEEPQPPEETNGAGEYFEEGGETELDDEPEISDAPFVTEPSEEPVEQDSDNPAYAETTGNE